MRRFEWHDAKARSNLRKHGVDFERAVEAFDDPFYEDEYDHFSIDEERWIARGRTLDGDALVVVFTSWYEDDDVEVVRIISARKAKR